MIYNCSYFNRYFYCIYGNFYRSTEFKMKCYDEYLRFMEGYNNISMYMIHYGLNETCSIKDMTDVEFYKEDYQYFYEIKEN